MNNDNLSGSEAIYAFCAWLTTRNQGVTMGAFHNCSDVSPLIAHFCKSQGLSDPGKDYHERIKPTNDIFVESGNLFQSMKNADWKVEVKSFDISTCGGKGKFPDGEKCSGCLDCESGENNV